MCAMYYYASKLTAAALSAGLRVSDSSNSGSSIVCSCQEVKNGGECIGRSSPSSFRPLVNFTAQTLSGNTSQKIHSRLARVSGSGATGGISSTGPGNIFVTANVEHPRNTGYHRHRTKQKNLSQTSGGNVRGPGFSSSANICSSTTSMVNGANLESQDIRDNVGDREHALVYRDGNLVSGSLEALVQHMVPTEEYYPDRAYLFAFLLSSRLFIKPHELLSEVCALCEHQQKLGGEGGKERLQRFVPRLVQLLAEWTETFPYDFRDERVMAHVKSITQKVASVDATARQEVSALLQNLLLRLTALERYEEGLARLATESGAQQLSQVDVTELCPSATILAQQLTHVELERLSYIGPEEFVQAFAKESPHLETSFKEMKKTRNLESYVQWFNRLSYFVATEICKHAKKKQRVRVVEYWIETARECFNIGNFNSLMAIIAGLNMSSISRLKKTWSKVQSAKFAILEHQMDPSSNFSSYRSTLKAAMWRSVGATDERQRIVVPFFSLLVKDLYFLNEGCSNKLPNGHINFEKFWQLAKQVTEFIAWKQVTCPFEKNSRVIAFLQASPVLTENALSLASFECEPPDSNPEKERFKSLKSELNAQ
ncbi:ras-GEF domain-containing family member 1B isoform X2 [Diachasma alloeum]|uniref:ras-GEF domain-containing family member 1B isoform X2 n=1 Tax=Diachasma alloeum TaxID=454923 RepID=UPI0007381FE2|nr:ras-GEF domain-containing family member 1B isoform X2 [Diachasma alloeum]XP_015113117.1 ras-GEF domain-containing family member 1B isoform X2 [Diachasma alloeum]